EAPRPHAGAGARSSASGARCTRAGDRLSSRAACSDSRHARTTCRPARLSSMNADATRVLVVGAWFPFPPRWGWATRVYHLARQLARRHAVTLLPSATRPDQPHLPRWVAE